MTVTIAAKHDVSKTDDNDNETCCTDKDDSDHIKNLLEDTIKEKDPCPDQDDEKKENGKTDIMSYDEKDYDQAKKLVSYKEAPEYIKHNTYILSGYRGNLSTQLCLESIFWWTNETINIWSHIFGFVLFVAAAARDVLTLDVYAHFCDKLVVAFVLICFQACMLLSAAYHTFSCRSERDCDRFLSYDLFGIALSLLAIYISGIYYAFWCNTQLLSFYSFTVSIIFVIAMSLHLPSLKVNSNVKMLVFVGWAAYGVVPTVHWSINEGWFESTLVMLLLPKVIMMYVISATAFVIYITKVPERLCSGKFDYCGHSHQWWHFLVLIALYYWHSTGMVYLEYRFNHACASHATLM